MTEFTIPEATIQNLNRVPPDRPVAVLLRHSVRDPIPDGETGNDLPLTEVGVRLARKLGARLECRLASLHTSPVHRCRQTAEHIRATAGVDCEIRPDRLLGDPGIFIEDADLAWESFQRLPYWDLVTALIEGEELAGLRHGPTAVRRLTKHMLERTEDRAGLHVFVTHDLYVATLAAVGLGTGADEGLAPLFLDGVFAWSEGETQLRYRTRQGGFQWS